MINIKFLNKYLINRCFYQKLKINQNFINTYSDVSSTILYKRLNFQLDKTFIYINTSIRCANGGWFKALELYSGFTKPIAAHDLETCWFDTENLMHIASTYSTLMLCSLAIKSGIDLYNKCTQDTTKIVQVYFDDEGWTPVIAKGGCADMQ